MFLVEQFSPRGLSSNLHLRLEASEPDPDIYMMRVERTHGKLREGRSQRGRLGKARLAPVLRLYGLNNFEIQWKQLSLPTRETSFAHPGEPGPGWNLLRSDSITPGSLFWASHQTHLGLEAMIFKGGEWVRSSISAICKNHSVDVKALCSLTGKI